MGLLFCKKEEIYKLNAKVDILHHTSTLIVTLQNALNSSIHCIYIRIELNYFSSNFSKLVCLFFNKFSTLIMTM